MKFILVALYAVPALIYSLVAAPLWLWIVSYVWFTLCSAAVVCLHRRFTSASDTPEFNYELGRCNGHIARRNYDTGVVEFHFVDRSGAIHWAPFHHTYWRLFTPQVSSPSAASPAPGQSPAARSG